MSEILAARTTKLETVIEARGLSKVYWDGDRELQIFKQLSLSVKKGEGIAILGPSGSGKTTLLNILAGLDKPSEGEVLLEGIAIHSLSENEKARFRNKHVGFVFQFYHLLPEFSAIENVMLPALIGHQFKAAKNVRIKAERLLENVGLKERLKHFPSELSGGEQQRVAIARALINEPAFLFCDEPTGNLDAAIGAEIIGVLQGLFKRQNKTVLIVTHDERVAAVADRIWNLTEREWNIPKAGDSDGT